MSTCIVDTFFYLLKEKRKKKVFVEISEKLFVYRLSQLAGGAGLGLIDGSWQVSTVLASDRRE